MIEKDFVTEGLRRTRIDEYLEKELERAGYGGMDVQITPLGTMVIVYAERPGMVIGRGGKNVRSITNTLKNEFGLDNPQIEVKEVAVPELNPKIMAYKIANMLQRGMHFRRVAYSTIRRIMGAGAQGVEVTISGKIRGSRSAVAKFVEGYIKKCGEPSIRLVEEGFATVQLKPGVLGIYVRIMPPETVLPDSVEILPPKMIIEEDDGEVIEEEIDVETEEIIEEVIVFISIFRVGVAHENFCTFFADFFHKISKLYLFFVVKFVFVIRGKHCCLCKRSVRWIYIYKCVFINKFCRFIVTCIYNFNFLQFTTYRAEIIFITDKRIFIGTHRNIEQSFSVYTIQTIETSFV